MNSKYKKTLLIGRILSGLVALPFIASAIMKFMGGPRVLEGFAHLGCAFFKGGKAPRIDFRPRNQLHFRKRNHNSEAFGASF